MIEIFKLNLKCSNAAFRDDGDGDEDSNNNAARAQIALILRDAAKHVENGCMGRKLMDSNGNTVGSFSVIEQ
jgi:hypothetical protein